MTHKTQCECYYCKYGKEASHEFERKSIEEYGFYIHYVPNDCKCPNHANIHTHGIQEVFGHKDLQICIPVSMQVAGGLFHNIVNQIKEG